MTWDMEEEPADEKPVLPLGCLVSSLLRDEVHDDDFPSMRWALVLPAVEIEKDSPGFMETL